MPSDIAHRPHPCGDGGNAWQSSWIEPKKRSPAAYGGGALNAYVLISDIKPDEFAG